MKKLVKFEQPGCAPCALVGNYLDNELEVDYITVDVTKQPELAANYELASVPTVLLLHIDSEDDLYGHVLGSSVKFNPEELDELAKELEEYELAKRLEE